MKEIKHKRLIIIGLIIICILISLFSIPFIKYIEDTEKLRTFIDSFGHLSSIAYLLLITIEILIPFIPGEPFELLGGYIFGSIKGSILCFIGEAIGSIIVYFLVRKYGKKIISIFFNEKQLSNLSFLNSKTSFILFSILFILPGTPKDLLCYYAGLCNNKKIPTLAIITFGRIPSILSSTIFADYIGDKNYLIAIKILIYTIILSLIGIIYYNYNKKKYNND